MSAGGDGGGGGVAGGAPLTQALSERWPPWPCRAQPALPCQGHAASPMPTDSERPVRLPSSSPPPPLLLLFLLFPFLLLSLLLLLLLLLAVSPRVPSLGSRRRQGSPSPPPPTPRSNCRRRRCRRSARRRLHRRGRAPTADAASPGLRGRIAWVGPPESHSHLQSPAKLPPSSPWRNTFLGGSAGFCVISSRAEISPSWRIGFGWAGAEEEGEDARGPEVEWGWCGCARVPPGLLGSGTCSFVSVPSLHLLAFSVNTDKSQNADA